MRYRCSQLDNTFVIDNHVGLKRLLLREVAKLALGIRVDGGRPGLPTSRADFAVLVGVLVALDETQDLVDVAANGRIVHAVASPTQVR